jgi:hypothetical protein
MRIPRFVRTGPDARRRSAKFNFTALAGGGLVLLALGAGCTSKKEKQMELQRQQAFIAGQEQAWQQYRQQHPNSIRVIGPVANPTLEWREGLTLIRAIVEARYSAQGNPGVIVVQRGTEQRQFSAQQLLAGHDLELLPGDQVILRP